LKLIAPSSGLKPLVRAGCGGKPAGLVVTITTPLGEFTALAGLDGYWETGTGVLYPGDEVTVVAGDGLQPVVVTIPDPLTAQADAGADQVTGEIGIGITWQSRSMASGSMATGNLAPTRRDICCQL